MNPRVHTALRFFRIFLTVIAFPLLLYIIVSNVSTLTLAFQADAATIAVIIAITAASVFVNGLKLASGCALFRVRLAPVEAFNVAVSNAFYNIITPMKGGLAVKGMYLCQVREMSWQEYAASLAITQSLATATSLGLAILVVLWFRIVDYGVLAVLAVAALAVLLIAVRFRDSIAEQLMRRRFIATIAGPCLAALGQPRLLLRFTLWHILFLGLITLRLYFVFSIFVPEIELWQVLLIQSVITATLVISVTPANIGVQEGMVAIAATIFSIDPATAVVASLVERAFLLLIILPTGAVVSTMLMRKIDEATRPAV